MNLKLAEYNLETRKFERFLELGKDFLFCGDSIIVPNCSIEDLIRYIDPILKEDYHQKDQKDPFNRFNGLFDGRTYGEGRFVLVQALGVKDSQDRVVYQDDVCERLTISKTYKNTSSITLINPHLKEHDLAGITILGYIIEDQTFSSNDWCNREDRSKIIGNLHENPELYLN